MRVPKEHIRGDRGVALTRYLCGQLGFLFHERTGLDYGVDAEIEIVENEQVTGRLIGLQIKCGPSYLDRGANDDFIFRFNESHLQYWDKYAIPIVVVLVDDINHTCYWAEITRNRATKTGQGYKVSVPRHQKLDDNSTKLLLAVANPVVASSEFSLLSEEDPSFGPFREVTRYYVLSDRGKSWTKSSIYQVVLQITAEARASQYHRDDLAKAQYQDRIPQIVRVFVYHNSHEKDLADHIVKATWVAQSVFESGNASFGLKPGLQIEWNDRYSEISNAADAVRAKKSEYLEFVRRRFEALFHLSLKNADVVKLPDPLLPKELSAFTDESSQLLPRLEERPVPPIECSELDNQISKAIGYLEGAREFARQLLVQSDTRDEFQFRKYIEDAHETMIIARHELSKVSR